MLILVGASVRAAAFSAVRAGLQPWCADLFADRDLSSRCAARAVSFDDYPDGFLDLLDSAPAGPWMYTGALENHPRLIRRLAQRRTLWGNDESVLAVVRSPRRVSDVLAAEGLASPRVRSSPPRDGGRWLVKPVASAGGVGVRFLSDPERYKRSSKRYFQQYIEGTSASAVFVALPDEVRLLGVTRQLVGEAWLGARGFRYCGSVGPLDVGPDSEHTLQRYGKALVKASGMRGLFGIDVVLRDDGPWVVEVNPRYTASVEVLEHATGLRALALHREAFASSPKREQGTQARSASDGTVPSLALRACDDEGPVARGVVGKAILFARRRVVFPGEGPWLADLDPSRSVEEMPAFADVPHPGTVVEAGRPVLTFFARSADEEGCIRELRRIAEVLDGLLAGG